VAVRDSVISALDYKHGRSGKLIIVTSRHEIKDTTGVVMLTEEQDIVYRDLPALGVRNTMPTAVPADPQWAQEIHPETSLLFRYSALTFNGHRIHYDRPYATEIEGYPGLVVQGPLIATLLLELLEKELPGAQVAAFSFRAVSPLFDTTPFLVCGRVEAGGKDVILWAQTLDGSLAISANANLV
jgi:3-methylfumaryl-CoA hydratase